MMIWIRLLALMCAYLAYRSMKDYEESRDNFYLIGGILYAVIGLFNSFFIIYTILGGR